MYVRATARTNGGRRQKRQTLGHAASRKSIACGTQVNTASVAGSLRDELTPARTRLQSGVREPVCQVRIGIRALACKCGRRGRGYSPSRSAQPLGGNGRQREGNDEAASPAPDRSQGTILHVCALRVCLHPPLKGRLKTTECSAMEAPALAHHDPTTLQRAHTHRRNVAKQLTGLKFGSYSRCDGSLRGLNGNAGIGLSDQSAAAPATVSGESVVTSHWGPRLREGDDRIAIREPGDLPSVVVTREQYRSGCIGRCLSCLKGP